MPRRLKVQTAELGPLELFVIYERSGQWEEPWRLIQDTEITSILTVVSKEVYDHVLYGWSRPLVTLLGLDPKGALRKLPQAASVCHKRKHCPFFDRKQCFPTAKKMPWCYEADVSDDDQKRSLTSEVIQFWREGVYVVVVQEE